MPQVNNAPVPIPTCHDGPGGSCAVADFEAYVNGPRAALAGDFTKVCGLSNITGSPDVVDFYTDPASKLANTTIFALGVDPLVGVPNPFGS